MDKKGIEKACIEICDDSINMNVPWYIMAAYAYYVDDDPILEDRTFDRLAKKILKEWDEITHRHKEYLNKDMLEAGTYIGDYPPQIEGALKSVRESYK
jgi:hypothetical protein